MVRRSNLKDKVDSLKHVCRGGVGSEAHWADGLDSSTPEKIKEQTEELDRLNVELGRRWGADMDAPAARQPLTPQQIG